MNPSDRRNASRTSDAAGRWFLLGLGLFLALIGSCFVWLMARSYLRAKEMREWPEAPCVILLSEVEERVHDSGSAPEFRLSVSYGYEWQGQPYTGEKLTLRGNPWTSKRKAIETELERYPAGSLSTCRLSPADPTIAVLRPDSLAPGYSIWFPALFVVGGLGISISALKKKPGREPLHS